MFLLYILFGAYLLAVNVYAFMLVKNQKKFTNNAANIPPTRIQNCLSQGSSAAPSPLMPPSLFSNSKPITFC